MPDSYSTIKFCLLLHPTIMVVSLKLIVMFNFLFLNEGDDKRASGAQRDITDHHLPSVHRCTGDIK